MGRQMIATTRPPLRAIIFAGPVAHAGVDVKRALDRQVTPCRRYADEHGWQVISVVREKRPAEHGSSRPSILRLVRLGKDDRYDVLLVDRIRRLGTPPNLATEIVRQIEASGVRVQSVLRDAGPAVTAAILQFGLTT